MSKSQARLRDQGKKQPPVQAPVVVTHEIIPGKFSENDWIQLLEHDDSDEFVTDIVETICSNSLDIIYKSYIQSQLIPYTVCQAKDAIVQILEWQFLEREVYNENAASEPEWFEDEEPVPAGVDCWAQGSVPRTVFITSNMPAIDQTIAEEAEEMVAMTREASEGSLYQSSPVQGSDEPAEEDYAELTPDPAIVENENETRADSQQETLAAMQLVLNGHADKQPMPPPAPAAVASKKPKFKRHTGPLPSAHVSKMTESLDQAEMRLLANAAGTQATNGQTQNVEPDKMQMPLSCQSLLKLQAGRPPGNREVVYDEHGNVVSVVKVDVDKLSSYTVKTIFRVIDPETEAAQARLEAMRTGKYKKTSPQNKFLSSATGVKTTTKKSTSKADLASPLETRERLMTLPPPLMESMNVAAGVVVREGERVKEGPRLDLPPTARLVSVRPLQPIRLRPDAPLLHVADLLDRPATIKPLADTVPIPPISQHPIRGQ